MVYDDAWAYFKDVIASGTLMFQKAVSSLCGTALGFALFNSTSWTLDPCVLAVDASLVGEEGVQQECMDGKSRLIVTPRVGQFASLGYDPSVSSQFSPVSIKGLEWC